MLRAKALVTLFSSTLMLAACGQLIGLGDYTEVEGSAAGQGGDGGKGGGAGKAGSAGKGGGGGSDGGAAGQGGTGAVNAGSAGETSEGGNAGESGMGGGGGAGGSGGAAAGEGGSSAGGESGGSAGTEGGHGGQGGAPQRDCTEITIGPIVAFDSHEVPETTRYFSDVMPIGAAAPDYIALEFYNYGGFDGGRVGTFNLGTLDEAQYATCSRCVLVYQDNKLFFQESGSLIVQSDSDQMNGAPNASLEDVTLIEVEISLEDLTSTPVEGGDCLHITQATVARAAGGEVLWGCHPSWKDDSLCDCGCLTPDPDCPASTSDVCEPNSCWCPKGEVCNAENNWLCEPEDGAGGAGGSGGA